MLELIGAVLKLIILLPLVLFLVYVFIRYGLARMGGAVPGRVSQMRVVDRVNLSAKNSIFVVEVAGQYYLMAAGEGGTTLLKELEWYPEVETEEYVRFDFVDLLQKTKNKLKNRTEDKGDEDL